MNSSDSLAPENGAGPYSRHVPALDGVRGLAVLAVMSSHLFPGTPRTPLLVFIVSILEYGATGVDLFFVLSGFLITGILYDSLRERRFFLKFYMRRILRIAPLYYVVLAAYALGALFLGMRYNGELVAMAFYLQNTGLVSRPIYDYAGPSMLPLAHFWSLAVEEQFYLIWPLLVFLLRTRGALLVLCLAATVLCPVFRFYFWTHGWGYYPVHQNTLFRADALLAGGALALLLRSPRRESLLQAAPWVLGIGVLMVLSIQHASEGFGPSAWQSAGLLALRYTALNLLYTGVIATALRPNLLSRLTRSLPLTITGRYSYGLYILHLPLFAYLQQPLRGFFLHRLHLAKGPTVVITGLTCFVLTFALAAASFRFFESPILRLKRFFSYGPTAEASTAG